MARAHPNPIPLEIFDEYDDIKNLSFYWPGIQLKERSEFCTTPPLTEVRFAFGTNAVSRLAVVVYCKSTYPLPLAGGLVSTKLPSINLTLASGHSQSSTGRPHSS